MTRVARVIHTCNPITYPLHSGGFRVPSTLTTAEGTTGEYNVLIG
jgi:hypothetical protein